MAAYVVTLLLAFLLLPPASTSPHPDIPPLLALKAALSPPLPWPDSPHPATSPCRWRGVICNSAANPERVSVLHLPNSGLHGPLSPHFRYSLPYLRLLNLSSNFLSGSLRHFFTIPPPFPRLAILDLSYNSLSGALPSSLAFCSSLQEIYLSHNLFSGSIPPSLGSLPDLLSLSLNHNRFVGVLPASLSRCSKLQFLDVADNFLSGPLPSSLTDLRFFNASHNLFEGSSTAPLWFLVDNPSDSTLDYGRIAAPPKASPTLDLDWVPTFVSLFSAIVKNFRHPSNNRRRALEIESLVEVASYSDFSVLAPAPAPSVSEKSSSAIQTMVKWLTGGAIGICAGGITAVVGTFLLRMFLQYWRRPKPDVPLIFQQRIIKLKHLDFLQKEDGLEGTELLGAGGSGKVFKAVLESGKVVAIKRVISLSNDKLGANIDESYDAHTKNSIQIQAELRTLAQVRHRNLVTLLAYVPRAEAHLLIYDFMENGSLHDALHKATDGSLNLTWPMRHNIAVGTARGLKYLHTDCSPRIIHCDLKPGNILLDRDFEAHVSDFGLAKILPDTATHCTSENVAGTVGYIAPEYYNTLRFTPKGDVYSFGVVLTVLLTGKEPTDNLFSGVYTHMGSWVIDCLTSGREKAIQCFDANLLGQGYEEQMLLALKVAAFCVYESAAARPTMNDVLQMLLQIRPAQ